MGDRQNPDILIMDVKRFVALKKLNIGIFSITFGFVFFLSFTVFLSLFNSNPYKFVYKDLNASPKLTELLFDSGQRAPASVAGFASSLVAAPGAQTFDLDCLRANEKVSTQVNSGQLRLRAQLCGLKAKSSVTEIVNTTNGYTATVFQTSDRHLSSDYIQLNEGLNHIRIQFQDPAGALQVSELLVSRLSEVSQQSPKEK